MLLISGLVPHQHPAVRINRDGCKNIHRMPEILLLHEQTESSERKVSLSCFRGITVLTKFKLAVQLHFLLFLRISFGSFIHMFFQHEDAVLVIVVTGIVQL